MPFVRLKPNWPGGQFHRTVDGQLFEFAPGDVHELTDAQFKQVEPDIGKALQLMTEKRSPAYAPVAPVVAAPDAPVIEEIPPGLDGKAAAELDAALDANAAAAPLAAPSPTRRRSTRRASQGRSQGGA